MHVVINYLVAGAAATLAASMVVSGAAGASRHAARHAQGATAPAPRAASPMKPHTGPLPVLPRISIEPPRPIALIHQVYEFAARHPEVLQYVPCYCGCERDGHGGNHDCFVKRRAADGRVREFDPHGVGCAICIDVASDAMVLFDSGANPTAIRAAIDRKYGSRFPSSTPTPPPPARK